MMTEPQSLFNLHKEGMDYTLFRPGYPVSVFIEHFTQREYSQLGAREKAIAFHNQEIATPEFSGSQ